VNNNDEKKEFLFQVKTLFVFISSESCVCTPATGCFCCERNRSCLCAPHKAILLKTKTWFIPCFVLKICRA